MTDFFDFGWLSSMIIQLAIIEQKSFFLNLSSIFHGLLFLDARSKVLQVFQLLWECYSGIVSNKDE